MKQMHYAVTVITLSVPESFNSHISFQLDSKTFMNESYMYYGIKKMVGTQSDKDACKIFTQY